MVNIPEYRCVIDIRYPIWLKAPSHYDAQEKAMYELGVELLKNGLVNYMNIIECEEVEE